MKRVIAASERAKTLARPLPRCTAQGWLLRGCLLAVVIFLMVWLSLRHVSPALAFIPLFVFALVMAIWEMLLRRCPQCRHRLIFRQEDVYGTSLYRELYDCSHCHTVRDTGSVGDHEKDKG